MNVTVTDQKMASVSSQSAEDHAQDASHVWRYTGLKLHHNNRQDMPDMLS